MSEVEGGVEQAGNVLESVRRAALLRRWSRSSKDFAYGAPIKTVDEHAANSIRDFPDRDDVRWILDRLDAGWKEGCPENVIIWKSRQHFCSHAVHASSLWLAAFRRYTAIAYVAQEEQEGKDHIEERIVGMWERLPAWFQRLFKWGLRGGVFVLEEREGQPWRSYIEPIARGSRKLRSWTYSRIHWDEAAHNDLLEVGYVGAHATVQGKRNPESGKIEKGQIVFTTSAAFHPFLIGLTGTNLEPGLQMARAS